MNRDELVKNLEGVVASMKSESAKLSAMYSDMSATKEARDAQAKVVKDLEDRADYFENEIKKFDDEVNSKMGNSNPIPTPAPKAVDKQEQEQLKVNNCYHREKHRHHCNLSRIEDRA